MKQTLRKLGLLPKKRKGKFPYEFDLQKCCPELSAELAAPVQWQKVTQGNLQGETAARFKTTAGALKWHHYFAIYDELFAVLRNTPINLLEIGVYKGASTHVWKQYFHPASRIVGIDIDPECATFADPGENVHVCIGPQQDQAFLSQVVKELGPFDLIIDDGSHFPSHMIASFNCLFAIWPEGRRPVLC